MAGYTWHRNRAGTPPPCPTGWSPATPPHPPSLLTFPQGRITDHRVGLTEHGMEDMLAGAKLPAFIEALRRQEQVELLASLHEAEG